jgi:predicted amidohydrolase YtcJ
MTAGGRPVEALAIGGGKILAAGASSEVSALAGSGARIVDLRGRSLFPGFIDPHHHTVVAALVADLLIDVGYGAYRSRADALSGLKAAAAKTPSGE